MFRKKSGDVKVVLYLTWEERGVMNDFMGRFVKEIAGIFWR